MNNQSESSQQRVCLNSKLAELASKATGSAEYYLSDIYLDINIEMNPSLINKNAICVGGTSGIGKGIAIRLAQSHANVTIIGRNAEMGQKIVSEMKCIHPNGQYEFMKCDAASMKDIFRCCAVLKEKLSSLNYLVLTQGYASINGYDATPEEGLDRKLALHYYGRMAFIRGLSNILEKTSASSDVRVLSVLSGGVHSGFMIKDDLFLKTNFSIANCANTAGTYNDLGLDKFAALFPSVGFIHAAPGVVSTNWGSGFPLLLKVPVQFMMGVVGMSPAKCAENMCKALWNDEFKAKGGVHVMSQSGAIGKTTSLQIEENRELLWNHTTELFDKYDN